MLQTVRAQPFYILDVTAGPVFSVNAKTRCRFTPKHLKAVKLLFRKYDRYYSQKMEKKN